MEECDDLVAEVEELLGLVVKELPVLLQRSQVLAETCDAEYRFAAKGGEMRMPLDIGVALREHRFNVAAVSSVVHPLGDGNVVRRHPSSISLRARSRSPWRLSHKGSPRHAREADGLRRGRCRTCGTVRQTAQTPRTYGSVYRSQHLRSRPRLGWH